MATAVHPLHQPKSQRTRIEHELDLIRGAIAMVTAGAARRISLVVGNGAVLLAAAQAEGRESGVIVRAVWHAHGAACDLIVEPIG